MKKGIIFIIIIALILVLTPSLIYAGPKGKGPAEKTTGDVGYDANGLQRYAEFNAFQLNECSSSWSIVGNWVLTAVSGGNTYSHDVNITSQDGGTLVGTGGYPAGGSYTTTWSLLGGSNIDGSSIRLEIDYDGSNYSAVDIGTIQSDGSITGTWTDSNGNSGNWSAPAGSATKVVTGCDGKGIFHYSDVNGSWYDADVQFVNVDGDYAYFAGLVTSASNAGWIGNWVSVAVYDGGEPAYEVDAVWGIFTNENTAKLNVVNKVKPGGEFDITSGNLQVHSND